MKLLILSFLLLPIIVTAQIKQAGIIDNHKPLILTEASCGQCKFGFKGKGCDLAVRIKGKSYFVDGINIDSLGDAHAKHGLCNSIRKAEAQGEIKNNHFVATYLSLLPVRKKK